MEFGILGPVEVRGAGGAVSLGGQRQRALLAMLLLHPNEAVSAERIALGLWGEDADTRSAKAVQVYVSRLRSALGEPDRLTTTPAGYRLAVRDSELDAARFAGLVAEGRTALEAGRADDAARLLHDALGLWRGAALADVATEPFAPAEVARLEEERAAALELRIDADLAAGRHAELVGELQRLVRELPLREGLHGRLMRALYRSGRQAEALQAYRDAREALVDELGIEPGPELRELERAVLEQAPELALADAARPVPIPAPPTETIGRDRELAELTGLLAAPAVRLVTLLGPGGVGKTRLAIEAARESRDGAAFASLGAVGAAEHVAEAVAHALAVTPVQGETAEAALLRALAGRRMLLVLDNFEHVLDAAPLVAALLEAAPELTVLATSREPLRLRAEQRFALEPLPVAGGDGALAPGPAVALFERVARAHDRRFRLGPDELPAAIELCRRLDGLPLAIELAAGRAGLLPVAGIAAALEESLDALGAGPRDAPDRQRTLTAALEWSHVLLGEDEQRALAAMAAFAGGATLAAARAVTAAPDRTLEDLVAKNLITTARTEAGVRLDMLETIRAYARSKLDARADAEAIRARHCRWFVDLAETTSPELERTGSDALLAMLSEEHENLRAAVDWALANDTVLALRLGVATTSYLLLRALPEDRHRWLGRALAQATADVPDGLRGLALGDHALLLALEGRAEEAAALAREGIELRDRDGAPAGRARARSALARVLLTANRVDESHAAAAVAEELAREAGDRVVRAWALGSMAMTAPTIEEAVRWGEEASALFRAAGNLRELAALSTSLVYTALFLTEYEAAMEMSAPALQAAEALGDRRVLALAFGNQGLATLFAGLPDEAARAFARELALAGREGSGSAYSAFQFEAVDGLAAVAAAEGDDRRAATLHGAAAAMGELPHDPVIAAAAEARFFGPARARLGAEAWRDAFAAGEALGRAGAIDLASGASPLRVVA